MEPLEIQEKAEEEPKLSRFKRFELSCGIVFGVWNNVSTVINAHTLYNEGHATFAALTLFFLVFPGLVTSIAFVLVVGSRVSARRRLTGAFILLVFYPLVPIVLCIYTLTTGGKRLHVAALAKLFEGFLDDGPQFVLKLVVVVLYGIGLSSEKYDVVFVASMATSFLALVYFALKFNERQTFFVTKLILCCPMLAAFALARAFTLAVFLKETLGHPKEFAGGILVLIAFGFLNVGSFRHCGQDWIRSVVFGLCSVLVPAGYGNVAYFFQRPYQPMTSKTETETQMKSGRFLLLYTTSNALLLFGCGAYVAFTRRLDVESDNALILPLMLAVIPGCFFAVARAILLPDLKPKCVHDKIWKPIKCILSVALGAIGYGSLIPAIFWSLIYKAAEGIGEALN